MAATIAHAYGRGKNYESHASRLGAESSRVEANTFKTFTTAVVNKDGSGLVQVSREIDGKRVVIHRAEFGPEADTAQINVVRIDHVGSMAPVMMPRTA